MAQMDRFPLVGDAAGNIIPRKRHWALAIHNSIALVSYPRYTNRRNGGCIVFTVYDTVPFVYSPDT